MPVERLQLNLDNTKTLRYWKLSTDKSHNKRKHMYTLGFKKYNKTIMLTKCDSEDSSTITLLISHRFIHKLQIWAHVPRQARFN